MGTDHRTVASTRAKSIASAVAIGVMFGLACYSLFLDRTATAGVAAAMTLALVLIQQLHLLESFEILSLKAKFTARIGEAEKLLAHIRQSAAVSSKLSYVQLAFMNRMGDIGWARKRGLLAEIDTLLRAVKVPADEIASMKAPFLNLVTLDLSRVFEHSIRELLKPQRDALEAQIREYSSRPIPAGDQIWSGLLEQRRMLERSPIDWEDALGNPALAHLRATLTDWSKDLPIVGHQRELADHILAEVSALSEACWASGTVTQEAEAYLEQFGHRTDARVKALLGSE